VKPNDVFRKEQVLENWLLKKAKHDKLVPTKTEFILTDRAE